MAEIKFDLFEQKEEYKDPAEIAKRLELEKLDGLDQAQTAEQKEAATKRYSNYEMLWKKYPEEFPYLYQMEVALSEKMEGCRLGESNGKLAILFANENHPHITVMKEGADGKLGGSIVISDAYAKNMKSEDMAHLSEAMASAGVAPESMHSDNENLAKLLDEIKALIESNSATQEHLDKLRGQFRAFQGPAAAKFEDVVKAMEDSIKRNLAKRKGRENIKGYEDGDIVFDLYSKDYSQLQGKDLKAAVPDARIFIRKESDGTASFRYHTKGNGPVDASVASTMMDAFKDSKYDSVNLSKVIDRDRNTLMEAAAKKGLVPMGVYINPRKAQKLIEAANGNLKDADMKKFKLKLALAMRDYNAAHGKDSEDDRVFVSSLINGYRNAPLKDAWDLGGLKKWLEKRTKDSSNPENTLAAMYAMNKVLNAYKSFGSIGGILNAGNRLFDTDEELKALKEYFSGKENMPINKLSPDDLIKMADTFIVFGTKRAQAMLKDGFIKNANKESGVIVAPSIVMKPYFDNDKTALENTIEELKTLGCELKLPGMVAPQTYPKVRSIVEESKKAQAPAQPIVISQGRSI